MKAKPFLIGLSAGIVSGTIAALLSTPQSGKTLRSNISNNIQLSQDILTDIQRQIENLKNSFSTLSNEAKNNIPTIINDLKDSIQTFQNDIEPNQVNIKQEIVSLQKSIDEIEQNIAHLQKNKKQEE